MSVIAAVGGDTYGGLSGFKRPTAGAPTRLGRNLPSFRGVPGKPGDRVKAPAIKSSANRNNRGTNITIPYARDVPRRDFGSGRLGDLGCRAPGDVVFVARDRPGMKEMAPPGYAHARQTRLIGVDYLNKLLEQYGDKDADGKHRAIFKAANGDTVRDAAMWRNVPLLNEWTLDGVVLSNDDPGVHDSGRDGQLFNIAVQGPALVNNGYIDEQGLGVYSRSLHSIGMTSNGLSDATSMSNLAKANHGGSGYHLFPLQMFDRNVGMLHELLVVLVATEHENPGATEIPDEPEEQKKKRELAREVYTKAGIPFKGDGSTASVWTFKYVLSTNAQLWDLNKKLNNSLNDAPENIQLHNTGEDTRFFPSSKQKDLKNYVGAWRIGKVIDSKAAKMPSFTGGPSDTGFRVNVNVCVEWLDSQSVANMLSSSETKYVRLAWPSELPQQKNLKDMPPKAQLDEEPAFDENYMNVGGPARWEAAKLKRKRGEPDGNAADTESLTQSAVSEVSEDKRKPAILIGGTNNPETNEGYGKSSGMLAPAGGQSVEASAFEEEGRVEKAAKIAKLTARTKAKALPSLEPAPADELKPVVLPKSKPKAKADTTASSAASAHPVPEPVMAPEEDPMDVAPDAPNAPNAPVAAPEPMSMDIERNASAVAAAAAMASAPATEDDDTDNDSEMASIGARPGKTSLRALRRPRNSPSPSPGDSSDTGSSASSAFDSKPKASMRRSVRNSPSPSPSDSDSGDVGASAAPSSMAKQGRTASPSGDGARRSATASSAGRRARAAAAATGDVFASIFGGSSDAPEPLNPSHRAGASGASGASGATGASGASGARSFARRRARDDV